MNVLAAGLGAATPQIIRLLVALTALLSPSVARRPARGQTEIATVRPGHQVALYRRPGAQEWARVASRTPFGSPQTFGILSRRGRWLEVSSPDLPAGQQGWVRAGPSLRFTFTGWELRVSRSARRLTVLDDGRAVRAFAVGIGASASPTPLGRFTVTDKLPGSRFSPVYGCCIVALSGDQPDLPAGFTGGDRLAIHGTDAPSTIGQAVSAGCLHAAETEMRYLMAHVPLGAEVAIVR
ncbi:MAG: L,D-transpeptidase [Solirubrobacteraceae bacterium]